MLVLSVSGTRKNAPILGVQEILAVGKEHVLDPGFQDDRTHGSFLTRTCPRPTSPGAEFRAQ